MKNSPAHLAILARKSQLGKGKTRLAATVGPEKALTIYCELIAITAEVTASTGWPATVFFEPEPGDFEVWNSDHFAHAIQSKDSDLGKRMLDAASVSLAKQHTDKVIIMGTDCPELSLPLLQEASEALQTHDLVIGPSHDGGYYLLGLKKIENSLFENINWSTDQVFVQTTEAASKAGLSMHVLAPLHDIDTEIDWLEWRDRKQRG